MAKQQRNNPGIKQETRLKNRILPIVGGILLLTFIILGSLNLKNHLKGKKQEEAKSSTILTDITAEPTEQNLENEVLAANEIESQDAVIQEEPVLLEENIKESLSPQTASPLQNTFKAAAKTPQNKRKSTSTNSLIQSSVQWKSLAASIEGNAAVIRWSTQTELNTSYFEIERSIDEEKFEPIGKLFGSELANMNDNQYLFADSSLRFVGMPRIYYRIKQIGLDNKVHSSEIYEYDLGLDLGLYIKLEELKQGMLTVVYSGDREGKAKVGVLTPAGEIIHEEEVQVGYLPLRKKMDASMWSKGVYLLALYNDKIRVTEMLEITN